MQKSTTAHLALFGTNLFFALNFSFVKHLVNNGLTQPYGLTLVRAASASILLWLLFLLKPVRTKIDPKDYGRFLLCALTGIALNQLLFLKGLSYTYTSHASLLMLATPILVVILAAWLLKEKITPLKILGLILGASGAAVLIQATRKGGVGEQVFLGDILIILNALSYAVYFIAVKPLMQKYDSVMIIRMVFTLGTFMILPFGWNEFKQTPWDHYQPTDYVVLGLILFCGTFLAYLLNIYGIKILGASRAGGYIYFQPFLATMIAVIFMQEKLTWFEIMAACLIIIGVTCINYKKSNGEPVKP